MAPNLMPVERIVHLFEENGFDVNKATAHGLISKTHTLLECFDEVLRKAIHSDPYICMDETYHQIINEKKNKKGKATCKGYVWSAYANHLKLVHFFYKAGSREKEVFQEYLDKSYQGAVHIPPNASFDVLRELLPDRWKKLPAQVAIESSA